MKYQVGQLIKWRHTAGTDYGLIVAIEWLDNLCHDGMHLGQVKEVGVWILWADGLHYIKCAPDNIDQFFPIISPPPQDKTSPI